VVLTDSDVESLAWEFLQSHYVATAYAGLPLERRLDSFLRRRGLNRVADDGDLSAIVLGRVMGYGSPVGAQR
jgi:hypothetical protein